VASPRAIPEPAPRDRHTLGDAIAAALILALDRRTCRGIERARARRMPRRDPRPIRADEAVSAGTAARRERVGGRGHRRAP